MKISFSKISDRQVYKLIILLSGLILSFLFWLIYINEGHVSSQPSVRYLPLINAILNSLTTVLLIFGFYFIKKGWVEAHIKAMLTAVFSSALFLVGYIIYHHFHGDTKFLGEGVIRPIYFFILISHIFLSVFMVPLVFATLFQAFKRNFVKHKKLARITFPIWLYVSVTGVLIYLLLRFFG